MRPFKAIALADHFPTLQAVGKIGVFYRTRRCRAAVCGLDILGEDIRIRRLAFIIGCEIVKTNVAVIRRGIIHDFDFDGLA